MAPAPPTLELDAQVAAARHAWVNADFASCTSKLDNDTARDALAAGKRGLVARWLAWRAACLLGQGRTLEASRTAELLATWELEPPPDLAGMTPDVEKLIIDSAHKASLAARSRLELSGPVGAVVAVDGRPRRLLSAVHDDARSGTSRSCKPSRLVFVPLFAGTSFPLRGTSSRWLSKRRLRSSRPRSGPHIFSSRPMPIRRARSRCCIDCARGESARLGCRRMRKRNASLACLGRWGRWWRASPAIMTEAGRHLLRDLCSFKEE